MGSAAAGSGIALFMSLDGVACNENSGVAVPVGPSQSTATVTGTCTFDVQSDRIVQFLAVAQSQNATPAFISLVANSIAFVPDSILSVSTVGSGTVTSFDGRINCGIDCTESYSANASVTLAANANPGWTFTGWSGACSGAARTCALTMSAARTVTANFAFINVPPVVEFYNTVLDHYFITANPLEATAVDNGSAGPGWVRTGFTFRQGGPNEVCRFYGSITPGPNSHFYTVFPEECFNLQRLAAITPPFEPRWNFEGIAFMTTMPLLGACPAGTTPVYRAYNDGFARGRESNHRLTTSVAALNEVIARGWKSEGIVMCAP
jgi:hypothetical protein